MKAPRSSISTRVSFGLGSTPTSAANCSASASVYLISSVSLFSTGVKLHPHPLMFLSSVFYVCLLSILMLFIRISFKKIAGIRSGLPAHAISAMLFLPANVSYFSLFWLELQQQQQHISIILFSCIRLLSVFFICCSPFLLSRYV